MGVPNAKIFKFQALKLLNHATYDLIASFKAAGSAVFNLNPELATQMSGPSLFDIETEVSIINTEATLNIGEYGAQVMEALIGAKSTTKSISVDGLIEPPVNRVGSLFNATGAAIVGITKIPAEELKSGLFRIYLKDKASLTAAIQVLSSPDLRREDYADFDSGLLKEVVLADNAVLDSGAGWNINCAAAVDLATHADGDAFTVRVFAEGVDAYQADIGQRGLLIPKVKVICLGRTMSDGRWFEVLFDNCIFPGVNFNFGDEFSANEVSGKLIFDERTGRVGSTVAYQKAA